MVFVFQWKQRWCIIRKLSPVAGELTAAFLMFCMCVPKQEHVSFLTRAEQCIAVVCSKCVSVNEYSIQVSDISVFKTSVYILIFMVKLLNLI